MVRACAWILAVVAVGSAADAYASSEILHEPPPCLAPGDYPIVDAAFAADTDIRTAKVYFRSDKYPKFYYVEMERADGAFSSVLPKPSPETERIIYYIEGVDVTFEHTMGTEHVVEIADNCADRREGDEPLVVEPEIVVGAVEAGAPGLPPGFETVGIVGTITSAGLSSALGGGSGLTTAVAVTGVAAGVGGGVVVATAGGDEPVDEEVAGDGPHSSPPPQPPESAPPPPPTSTPSEPAPPPEPPEPPDPPPAPEPEPPEPDPPAPPSPVTACFDVSFPGGSCNMKLDASCSSGPVASFAWIIDPMDAPGAVTSHSGARVNRTFPNCAGETVKVTLTVTSVDGVSDRLERDVTLPGSLTQRAALAQSLDCSVTSRLDAGEASVSGRLFLDGGSRAMMLEGASPRSLELEGREGAHRLEALALWRGAEALWSFDFSRCRALEAGSLRPEGGQILLLEPEHIVFRVSGSSGERLRILYRLRR